jgi:hypothetical protein
VNSKEKPMLRKTLGAAAAALLGISMMATGSGAQDATPASECPTTTAEENVQIVEQYFDAVLAGDAETAASLLHEDFQHDLSMPGAEVPHDPSFALENIDIAGEVNHEVVRILAQDDWVAIDMEFDLTGEHLELDEALHDQSARIDTVVMAQIECGQIAEAHFTSNLLRVLLEHGFEVHPPGE